MSRPRYVYYLAGGMVAVSAIAAMFSHVVEAYRAQSSDGAFTVVARTQPFRYVVGTMPGQSSDRPALVSLYRGKEHCGDAKAEMLSMAYEMRWEMDAKPRRLEIKFVGVWDLDDCTVISCWQD